MREQRREHLDSHLKDHHLSLLRKIDHFFLWNCEVVHGPIDQTSARTWISRVRIRTQWRCGCLIESGNDEEPLHSLRGLFLKDGWSNGFLHLENNFSA